MSVEGGDQDVVAYVELSLLIEEGALDVLLHDEGLLTAVLMPSSPFEYVLDLLEGEADDDAVAPVGQLPWLHNPDVVRAFPLGLFLPLVESLEEYVVLCVLHAFGEVDGKGQVVEHSLVGLLVVLPHGVEESLLVPDDEVVRQVVLNSDRFEVQGS